MKMGTLCYIEQDGRYLLLHRNRRVDDMHYGLWVGLGGKFERGESPEECIVREVREESGLEITDPVLRGVITFAGEPGEDDWYVFLFTADTFTGELKTCDEGDLAWVGMDELDALPMHAGDHRFVRWLREKDGLFTVKFTYENGALTDCILNEYKR